MRVWPLAGVCALLVGACLYPEYGVQHDGGTGAFGGGGTAGAGGRGGGSAGAVATGGHGGVATGTAGGAGGAGTGGVAGSAGGGTGGAPGTGGSSAGSGGATAGSGGGAAGRGGTSGTGGIAGSAAGRGGTTGIAGTTGTAGSVAGRGGTTGVAGTTGTAGSVAGRGGSNAGTGGAAGRGGTTGTGGNAGSTVPPDWLQALSVVYKFDQAPDQLGVEAHGNNALHLEEQGTFLPTLDTTTAIQGAGSAKMTGTLQYPTYFQTPSGVPLPTVFQTEPNNSWTTGGWFHITATSNQQWLIHDEGPTDFQQGGFFFYVDQQVGKLASNTAFALCRVGVASNADPQLNNLKEVSTQEDSLVGDVGFDPVVPGNWVHLVCRYNAQANELSVFVAGARRAQKVDTTHTVKSGPGPFLLGCNEPGYCAFQGNMDEVFWTTSALSDAAINRIYACGIDGSRCRCNGSAYAACGFASITSCGNLPACGAASPP